MKNWRPEEIVPPGILRITKDFHGRYSIPVQDLVMTFEHYIERGQDLTIWEMRYIVSVLMEGGFPR